MRYLEQLRGVLKEGHDDGALVGLPIAMIRQIERDVIEGAAAKAQLAANAAIAGVCGDIQAVSRRGAPA